MSIGSLCSRLGRGLRGSDLLGDDRERVATGFICSWETCEATAVSCWAQAGLANSPTDDDPTDSRDRLGRRRLTQSTAAEAARVFAVTEPETVDLNLRGWEQERRTVGLRSA